MRCDFLDSMAAESRSVQSDESASSATSDPCETDLAVYFDPKGCEPHPVPIDQRRLLVLAAVPLPSDVNAGRCRGLRSLRLRECAGPRRRLQVPSRSNSTKLDLYAGSRC